MAIRNKPFVGPLATAWGERATTEALLAALQPPAGALPVPSATDRSAWDGADPATVAALAVRADADAGTPWPATTAASVARVFRDGDRDDHEQRVFARQHRLARAAVLAAARPDEVWIDQVAEGVMVLCEQSSWCWPAHDRFAADRGDVVPDVTAPFLDLGAAEVAAELAWVDHLLGASLDHRWPGLRRRLRHEVDRRVLRPFEERDDWHWIGLDGDVHNWNPWIHGNLLVAVLALVTDPRRRAELVTSIVTGIDRYVASLPEDGAIDEGYAYWWNGACRALEALDVLRYATRGSLDASRIDRLRQTVAFPHRMHLGGRWYLNVADGQARTPATPPWHALHRAARSFHDDDAARHAAVHRVPGSPVADESSGLGRLLQALTDQDWLTATPTASPLPRDVWLPSVQVLVARRSAGASGGLTLTVKGGHNDEHHNHNDVGSFVVARDGVPVIVDAGRPTYTRQTFSSARYDIWTMQSAWHNVPEVGGVEQPASRAAAARDVAVTVADTGSALRLDLAPAYPGSGAQEWIRTAALDRRTGTVTIDDRWLTGDDPCAPSRVRLLLAGQVTPVPDGIRVQPLDGAGTVELRWSGDVTHVHLDERHLDDPLLTEVWGPLLTRLTLTLAMASTGAVRVTVRPGG